MGPLDKWSLIDRKKKKSNLSLTVSDEQRPSKDENTYSSILLRFTWQFHPSETPYWQLWVCSGQRRALGHCLSLEKLQLATRGKLDVEVVIFFSSWDNKNITYTYTGVNEHDFTFKEVPTGLDVNCWALKCASFSLTR